MPSKQRMATRQKASPAWPNKRFNGFVGKIQTNSKEQNSADMVRCATSSHSEAGGIPSYLQRFASKTRWTLRTQMCIMFRFEGMATIVLHTRCTYKEDWWQWHTMNFDCMIWICHVASCIEAHEQYGTSSNLPDHRLRLKTSFTCQVMPSAKCSNRSDTLINVSHLPMFQVLFLFELQNLGRTWEQQKSIFESPRAQITGKFWNQLACFVSNWFQGRWWEGGNSETNATMGGTVSRPGWVWWRAVDQRFWRWTSNSDRFL